MMLVYGLALAGGLAGRVTGEDGSPVTGATVVAYDARLNYVVATTDFDGDWAMYQVPAGPWRVRVAPDDDDGWVDRFWPDTWDYCTGEPILVGDEGVEAGLDMVLPRGGTLAGRLLDADGQPVGGAVVVAEGVESRTALALRSTLSQADGTFTVRGLDADPGVAEPYRCYVDVDGWPGQFLGRVYDEEEAAIVDVDLGEPAEVGDQPLLDGITVTGTVRGPDGPVAGGTVYVYASSQVLAAAIAPDGTYVGDGLPPGNVVSWATVDGLATTYYPDADRPGTTVPVEGEGTVLEGMDLTLPVESTVTFTFTGARGGDLSEVSVLLYNDTFTVGRGGGLDTDGRITIDGLHPAAYTLYVYGSDVGYVDDFVREGAAERVFEVSGDATFDLELVPAASLAGTVVDETGAPVYGAYVYAVPASGEGYEVVATDRDGAWRIGGLAAGDYQLRGTYTHYCPADPGHVTRWWPDALTEDRASWVAVGAGEALDGYDLRLDRDDDHDQMGDAWEDTHGLDSDRDDAAEDADGDGVSNYDEWLLGTDPTDAGKRGGGCGCAAGGGEAGLVALLAAAAVARRRRPSAAHSGGRSSRSSQAACTGSERSSNLRW